MTKNCFKRFMALSLMFSFGLSSLGSLEPEKKAPHSVVIVGGGIGALTSAIYLARSGVTPVVIEGKVPGGALAQSPKVQNWPGELEITGLDLMDKIHRQAEKNGVIFLQEEVVGVDLSKRPFTITTQDLYDPAQKHVLETSSCIIATGSEPKRLHIKGEQEYWSKGVYSCAVCDGSLYRNSTVAVIGGGDAALTEAEYLSQIAQKVYVVVRKNSLKANEKQREEMLRSLSNIEFLFGAEVQEIKGENDAVTELALIKDGTVSSLPVNAVFLAIGAKPNSQLFANQVAIDESGYIKVNQDFETSRPGVYAIGDIVDPYYKQAISAAGDGAKAALKAHHYLLTSSVRPQEVRSERTPIVVNAAVDPTLQKKTSYPAKVIEITSAEQFQKEIADSSLPILVDFYASWCGPCRHLSPKLEAYAKELKGKAKVLKVNIQTCGNLADLYQIKSMPTLIVFDTEGKAVDRRTGTREILEYLSTLR